jgi:hypothetical protein
MKINLCRRPDREAVGTDATCVERRDQALGKGVDQGLPRLTVLCREPAGAVGRAHLCADGPPSAQAPLPRAPPGSRQRSNFFIFGVCFFLAKGTLVKALFPILVFFWQIFTTFHVFSYFLNFSAYFKFELRILKTMHVYDWKIDIVACYCEFSTNLGSRAKIQTTLCESHVHPLLRFVFKLYKMQIKSKNHEIWRVVVISHV